MSRTLGLCLAEGMPRAASETSSQFTSCMNLHEAGSLALLTLRPYFVSGTLCDKATIEKHCRNGSIVVGVCTVSSCRIDMPDVFRQAESQPRVASGFMSTLWHRDQKDHCDVGESRQDNSSEGVSEKISCEAVCLQGALASVCAVSWQAGERIRRWGSIAMRSSGDWRKFPFSHQMAAKISALTLLLYRQPESSICHRVATTCVTVNSRSRSGSP